VQAARNTGTALRGENPTVLRRLTSGFAVNGGVQFLLVTRFCSWMNRVCSSCRSFRKLGGCRSCPTWTNWVKLSSGPADGWALRSGGSIRRSAPGVGVPWDRGRSHARSSAPRRDAQGQPAQAEPGSCADGVLFRLIITKQVLGNCEIWWLLPKTAAARL